jgi:hypothetical protein
MSEHDGKKSFSFRISFKAIDAPVKCLALERNLYLKNPFSYVAKNLLKLIKQSDEKAIVFLFAGVFGKL